MKTSKFKIYQVTISKHFILLICFISFLGIEVFGQAGYSSASYSMGKQRSDDAMLISPPEVYEEEFINYHRHDLPLPQYGESVAMEMRFGNKKMNPLLTEAILQIGFTTDRITDYSEMTPLNLSLVIDKSGSMSGEKLAKTKEALRAFVKRLRTKDIVSIVVFDHNAQVLLAPHKAENIDLIDQAIENIQIGGSTNLHDGILTGYRQILANYNVNSTNKVIVLTDAITNTGEMDPEIIIRNSSEYDAQKTIDFAMIGVGVDFNNQLSRQLSKSKKSQIHFIHNPADIVKVFIEEAESLLSPIARDVKLEIEYPKDLELDKMYGYSPIFNKNKISLELDNMNSGLTQVVLLKFRLKNFQNNGEIAVKTRLSYYDIRKKKFVEKEDTKYIKFTAESWEIADMLKDNKVKKNYTIAFLASGLKEMAVLCEQKQFQKAKNIIDITIGDVVKNYPDLEDEDIKRVFSILEKYQRLLGNALAQR